MVDNPIVEDRGENMQNYSPNH